MIVLALRTTFITVRTRIAVRRGISPAVTLPRPRDRATVMEHPDYYKLREQLIYFLEVKAHKIHAPAAVPVPASDAITVAAESTLT